MVSSAHAVRRLPRCWLTEGTLLCRLSILFLTWIPLLGFSDNLRFTRTGINDGLSQSTAQILTQDHFGFIWVGTHDGLNRFDGYEMRIFKPEPGNPQSLSDNYVRSLLVDRDGRLWIGTRGGGLNLYDEESERFHHYKAGEPGVEGLLEDNIACILQSRDGMVWLALDQQGLCYFDPEKPGTFYLPHLPQDLYLPGIITVYEDSLGLLWVGSNQVGLYRLSSSSMTKEAIQAKHYPELGNAVTAIHEDDHGRLWVGTSKGLWFRDVGQLRFERLSIGDQTPIALEKGPIEAIYADTSNNIWVGTRGEGLFRFPREHPQLYRHYLKNGGDVNSLGDNWVMDILEDHSNTLWFGTYGSGLARFDVGNAQFERYVHESGRLKAISNSVIQGIAINDRGTLWVGTRGGGLNFRRKGDRGFSHFSQSEKEDSLSHNMVRTVTPDDDLLWVGTDGSGMNRMSLDRPGHFLRIRHNPEDPSSLSHDIIRATQVDSQGHLWIGTYGGGINFLHRDQKHSDHPRFKHFRHDPDNPNSLSKDVVRSFYEDPTSNGTIFWIGTQAGGLNRMDFDGEKAIFKRYLPDLENPSRGPGHDVIIALCPGLGDVLWLGTPRGLNRFDRKTGEFTVYLEGLPNSVVYSVLRDERNYLWLSTNRGLSRFDPWAGTFKNFDIDDGLPGNEFNAGSAYRDHHTGKLYFGGVAGLTAFMPDSIQKNTIPPETVITELLLFNRPTMPGQTDQGGRESPLKRTILRTKSLDLRHDDIFTLKFAALHFASPTRNRFAYRLDGLNEDWVYTDAKNRTATFTNLSPGSYTFRVKSANKDDVWNDQPLTLNINITPPLYREPLAYVLYMVVATLLLLIFLRHQRNKLDQERRIIDRLKQVDRIKDEFLANTSHELRTPLNGMIGLAESLLDGATGELPEQTRSNLGMIVSSGRRLATLVNDILDFSRLKNQNLELNLRAVDLHAITDVVLSLSLPTASGKKLKLINEIPGTFPPVIADENRLQQILHNLVGNAVKFTEEGSVRVAVEREGDRCNVLVHDTGIGIKTDKLNHIFESFAQGDGATGRIYGGTGLGLAITRQLVQLHGSQIRVESEPGKGSTFSFQLALADDYTETGSLPTLVEEDSSITSLDPGDLPLGEETEPGEGQLASLLDPNYLTEGNTWHILIVDDEPVNRMVLHNHLRLRQFKLSEAANGEDALTLLDSDDTIDLVLLDIMMPRLSGYEVCRTIREKKAGHELPVIFLSARNQVADLTHGFQMGGNDYLTKPFSKDELMARLGHHLDILFANRLLAGQRQELARKNQELLETQQQLLVNERMVSLGFLTAGVSHEINNPASYAHGSVQNLEVDLERFNSFLFEVAGDDADSDIMEGFRERLEPIFKHVKIVKDGTDRIKSIVRDLNTFARGERKLERVQLTECLRTTLNLVKANFKESVIFETRFKDALHLSCRAGEMNQVFMNLIVNACQAIESNREGDERGTLIIETDLRGDEACISFQDSGCGIQPEVIEHIYEPFFTTKPQGKGTGQGLAISKKIIEEHGGRIEVSSEVGKGTRFEIYLPTQSKQAAELPEN